jgi:hypothetical protein
MALARVTCDPPTCEHHVGFQPIITDQPDVLLGGDASHHQDLYLPVPSSPSSDYRVPLPVIDGGVQLAINPPLATYTIGQLTRMSAESNVLVILAHEGQVEGVISVYPEDLSGWQKKGWKEAKEVGQEKRAGRAI